MDTESLQKSISEYKEQLKQINLAISASDDGSDKDDLINLKSDIEQLIELTEENLARLIPMVEKPSTSKKNDPMDDEYMLFMNEMQAEGCLENQTTEKLEQQADIEEDLKSLEGMKCQAPHSHTWGDNVFHNALVCSVLNMTETQAFTDIQVRVMFTNPTHQEMLPCPYYLEDSNCKFSDEQCRFSHGEVVSLSSLQEYKEPNFGNLKIGSRVLAKRSDNLWHRAIVRKISDVNCSVKFESSQKESSVPLTDVLPLEDTGDTASETSSDESENNEWVIQKSLLNTPSVQVLGDWEKHTKGIGSKLMQQMGYVIGTGLGRFADGRIDPVEAVVLPSGKSLDHCMNLRELAGDENLFSAERKLKKQQKRQETLSKKAYEREKKKKDVFEFLNNTLTLSKSKNIIKEGKIKREELKTDSNRELNVTSLKIEDDMRKVENELYKIKESLTRHNNAKSPMHTNLKIQLANKQAELNRLKDFARNVNNEQNLRRDKKKLTVF